MPVIERLYCDFEFNGWGGELISMGMVGSNDPDWLYVVNPKYARSVPEGTDPWVAENVLPHLFSAKPRPVLAEIADWGEIASAFMYGGRGQVVQVFADWPSDIADLCNILITGSGTAVYMPHQTNFTVLRHLDVYPTSLAGAVRHNAWWDAMALRRWVEEQQR